MRTKTPQFVLRGNIEIEKNSKLSAKSKARLKKAKADNTLRAYEADWYDFYTWCRGNGQKALPAEPETIVNYVNELADYAKANTVSRRLTAISENHKAAGYQMNNPAGDAMVRSSLAAIKREKGTLQHGKSPLLIEDLAELAPYFDEGDIAGVRDKALILTGFAGAFRRSELVRIEVGDLTFVREGVIILVHHSKGDQTGEGQYVAVPYHPDVQICMVRAVKKWLSISGIKSGPLFRPFTKKKELRDRPLSDRSVALIVKKYTALSGLNADDFAGHSLRRGFATSAALHDVDERLIMQQTRHHSEKMVRRYIEQGNLFKNNPWNKLK